jgi:Choline/ethanolamine kinase
VRRAERASGLSLGRGPGALVVSRARLAVRPGRVPPDLPVLRQVTPQGAEVVPPGDAAAALAAGWRPQRERVHADAVVAARLSGPRTRVRAFYLDRDEPVSLLVHARPWRVYDRGVRRLLDGVAVQSRWPSGAHVLVPAVLGSGSRPGFDWVAEQLLVGRHPTGWQWQRAAPVLVEELLTATLGQGVQRRPLRDQLPAGAVTAILGRLSVATRGVAGASPSHPPSLEATLRRLADSTSDVLVGTCHGDPVQGNVLVLPGGRLALVDWEHAGSRLVAHDTAKILVGAADPLDLFRRTLPLVGPSLGPGMATWPEQLAVALLQQVARWQGDRGLDVAVRSGRADKRADRIAAQLRLLAALLAPDAPDAPHTTAR